MRTEIRAAHQRSDQRVELPGLRPADVDFVADRRRVVHHRRIVVPEAIHHDVIAMQRLEDAGRQKRIWIECVICPFCRATNAVCPFLV